MNYFIHIPRSAGTSIISAINTEQVTILHHNVKQSSYKHPSAICTINDSAFAFVRNPYERLASAFYYLKKGGINQDDNNDAITLEIYKLEFNDFITKKLSNAATWQTHFIPQSYFLRNIPNLKIFKYENLDNDFYDLCESLNTKNKHTILPRKNSSEKNPLYKNAYTTNNLEIINKIYIMDFKEYGYEFNF